MKIGAEVFGELRIAILEGNGEHQVVPNEEILERIGKKKTLLNNILGRKTNWIGHILRNNCLFHDAIEGQVT